MKTTHLVPFVGLALVSAMAVAALPATATAAAVAPTVRLVATSQDGKAFDLDEYVDGDVAVQVTSSTTGAIDVDDSQDLLYFWTIKPFAAGAPAVRVPATGSSIQPTEVNGKFVVPVPTGQPSGVYALSAGLGPDAGGTHAIASASLLTVKAGQADVVFADKAPLRFQAGTDHTVNGSLRLEDGTALPARNIDVGLHRGTTGSDPEPDAGLVPAAPATSLVDTKLVTTGTDGTFSVVLSDPAEAGQGTELGGEIQADSATTPGIGNAMDQSLLPYDLISLTPPPGTTATFTALGSGTPGESKVSYLTVTAPDDSFDTDPSTPGLQGDADTDRDPVQAQAYTLTLDHGFFTIGAPAPSPSAGDLVGGLDDEGTTMSGLTDANGQVYLRVGIGRDTGFDDDGKVTATVSAQLGGGVTGSASAEWSSADPLNGSVTIEPSPAGEQDAAVNPTLAGDRTYYEVVTRDQFGNPFSGVPVALTYSGDLDNWDYSDDFVTSDLDRSGDIWVDNFEAGDITITGTWADAPTRTYDATLTPVSGTADAVGSSTASYYEIDFSASKFTLDSSAHDVVKVGTPVTKTVTVRDQKGNPVRGFGVQFFRNGPEKSKGDPVAVRTTNRKGQATYTFVGTKLGRADVTAVISDGVGTRILSSPAVFGSVVTAKLTSKKAARSVVKLSVSASAVAAGARVQLYRIVRGKLVYVASSKLDATGTRTFRVAARDKSVVKTYVAVVRSTARSVADTSNAVKVR